MRSSGPSRTEIDPCTSLRGDGPDGDQRFCGFLERLGARGGLEAVVGVDAGLDGPTVGHTGGAIGGFAAPVVELERDRLENALLQEPDQLGRIEVAADVAADTQLDGQAAVAAVLSMSVDVPGDLAAAAAEAVGVPVVAAQGGRDQLAVEGVVELEQEFLLQVARLIELVLAAAELVAELDARKPVVGHHATVEQHRLTPSSPG